MADDQSQSIAALLLAAGRSTRFGAENKLEQQIKGVALIRRAALALVATSVDPIVIVIQPGGTSLANAAGNGRWTIVENPDAALGLSTSIRRGLSALPRKPAGVLIALADMPYVPAALIESLCTTFRNSGGRSIVFPVDARRRQGHPVIWPAHLFGELAALSGDQGGKSLIAAHAGICQPLAVDGDEAFFDVDTEADLQRARKSE